MDLEARVDLNCERKDGRPDGRKTGRLCRTLLKQVRQKKQTGNLSNVQDKSHKREYLGLSKNCMLGQRLSHSKLYDNTNP